MALEPTGGTSQARPSSGAAPLGRTARGLWLVQSYWHGGGSGGFFVLLLLSVGNQDSSLGSWVIHWELG